MAGHGVTERKPSASELADVAGEGSSPYPEGADLPRGPAEPRADVQDPVARGEREAADEQVSRAGAADVELVEVVQRAVGRRVQARMLAQEPVDRLWQWLLRTSRHEVLSVARGRRKFGLVVFGPGRLRGLGGDSGG
jgi:hypothetical protein